MFVSYALPLETHLLSEDKVSTVVGNVSKTASLVAKQLFPSAKLSFIGRKNNIVLNTVCLHLPLPPHPHGRAGKRELKNQFIEPEDKLLKR